MSQTLEPAQLVKNFINQTNKSIFLTGKAGTGKTTLLAEIIKSTHKQAVVVAPTGIAALNAGGVTIHSMFQLPFSSFIPDFGNFQQASDRFKIETKDSLMRHFNMNKKRISLLKNLELLVIDEVSMLRADLLDAIDWVLRNIRKRNEPFGGVQTLFIGDLLQLPPVVKNEEWSVLRKYYQGIFFFNAHVLVQNPPVYIELDKIYRQDDADFIRILNNLRNNQISKNDCDILNKCVQRNFDTQKNPGYITLTTHNFKADEINKKELVQLSSNSFNFEAEITGDFPPHLSPIEARLELKEGAQVMFIKNDNSPEKLFFNGKMGVVKKLSRAEIFIYFPEERKTIEVERFEWENIKYTVNENTKEISEETVGTFVHYPLKLAWAITVHKSQGLTFDKAILDVSKAFAPGQAYVALSRLRSISGLVLLQEFSTTSLQSDSNVIAYGDNKPADDLLAQVLDLETKKYLLAVLIEAFDFNALITAWRSHSSTYMSSGQKNEKYKHLEWARHQAKKLEELSNPSAGFTNQLMGIFIDPQFDLYFLEERVDKAYNYFYKSLDEILFSTLKKIEEVKRKPKIKVYLEELTELDELQTVVVLTLKKVRIMIESLIAGKPLQKESIWNDELKHYKLTKIALARHDEKQNRSAFDFDTIEEEEEILESKKTKKSTKKKGDKISSVDQTLALFESGKNISEIANQRVLSESTIYSHASQLIKAEKIELSKILDEKKIIQLQAAFDGYTEESISPLKEKYGNKFSWDELRLYKMSLLK
jgi:hypothetical protein